MRSQSSPGVVRGEFHTRLDDGRVRCDVCPRACTMHEGQRGFCFVRMAHDGEVVLTSYGRSSGFCIDPIEKKPLNHFFPGSAVLSFGTAGCNLGCRFCQNWDISKARELATLSSHASPDAIANAAATAGCRSVAFTYNDPVVFLEYAVDTAAACREQGIAAVAVSAGYTTPKARERFFASMDATNIDLKAFDQRFYSKLCFAELEPIKETLIYVQHETQVWLEVTTLLIPGQNDSEAEVGALCDWMLAALGPTVPLHFTAFHPDFKMVDLGPTPAATLTRARAQALACGLQNVYTGNIYDPEGQSTRCPTCKAVVIGRDGYDIGSWAMDAHGACRACSTPIAGRFAARPGAWGARRQPIQIDTRDEPPSSG